VVGVGAAGVLVDDDLAGLDDDMVGGQDLAGFDLEAVEAFQFQLPLLVGRFAAGAVQGAG